MRLSCCIITGLTVVTWRDRPGELPQVSASCIDSVKGHHSGCDVHAVCTRCTRGVRVSSAFPSHQTTVVEHVFHAQQCIISMEVLLHGGDGILCLLPRSSTLPAPHPFPMLLTMMTESWHSEHNLPRYFLISCPVPVILSFSCQRHTPARREPQWRTCFQQKRVDMFMEHFLDCSLLLANFLVSLCRPCLLDLGSEDPEERGGPQSTAAANRASGPVCFTQRGNKESSHPRKVV